MHELSICQALMTQVEEIAAREQAASVDLIVLSIGPLAGVEPELLRHAFPVAAAGSVAEQAELVIETQPLRVHCTQCGKDSEVSPNRLLCAHCGDFRTQLVSGDEMLLRSLELTRRDAEALQP